jgi:hypothetical protein
VILPDDEEGVLHGPGVSAEAPRACPGSVLGASPTTNGETVDGDGTPRASDMASNLFAWRGEPFHVGVILDEVLADLARDRAKARRS